MSRPHRVRKLDDAVTRVFGSMLSATITVLMAAVAGTMMGQVGARPHCYAPFAGDDEPEVSSTYADIAITPTQGDVSREMRS